jgi:hypothetical protein
MPIQKAFGFLVVDFKQLMNDEMYIDYSQMLG